MTDATKEAIRTEPAETCLAGTLQLESLTRFRKAALKRLSAYPTLDGPAAMQKRDFEDEVATAMRRGGDA